MYSQVKNSNIWGKILMLMEDVSLKGVLCAFIIIIMFHWRGSCVHSSSSCVMSSSHVVIFPPNQLASAFLITLVAYTLCQPNQQPLSTHVSNAFHLPGCHNLLQTLPSNVMNKWWSVKNQISLCIDFLQYWDIGLLHYTYDLIPIWVEATSLCLQSPSTLFFSVHDPCNIFCGRRIT